MFMHHIIPYYPSKENDNQVPGCIKVSRYHAEVFPFVIQHFWYPDENNPNYYWLVVSTRLKNISQLGWLFLIYGKIKNVPNHQPDYIQGQILIPTKKCSPYQQSATHIQLNKWSMLADAWRLLFFYLTFHDWEFLPQWELGSHHALQSSAALD